MKSGPVTSFASLSKSTLSGVTRRAIGMLQKVHGALATTDTTVPEMRPLAKLPLAASVEQMPLAEVISRLSEMPKFAQTREYFKDYPPLSNLGNPGVYRGILYQIVRLVRPKFALEIGSLFAGTTEVIARALWANGEGMLITIDPYGESRVPGILNQWSSELRKYVKFMPVSSANFFMDFFEEHQKIDFAFIDGNHDYEFAYFDLLSVARRIAPSGVVVLDNAVDPGVFFAAKTFLKLFPGWSVVEPRAHKDQLTRLCDDDILPPGAMGKELSAEISTELKDLSLETMIKHALLSPKILLSSVDGADGFILVAPPNRSLGAMFVNFRSGRLKNPLLKGFKLELSRPAAPGWLVYTCHHYLWPRDYHLNGQGHKGDSVFGKWEVKEGELVITVDLPRTLGFADVVDSDEFNWDVGLAFLGNDPTQFLSFSGEPNGILSD